MMAMMMLMMTTMMMTTTTVLFEQTLSSSLHLVELAERRPGRPAVFHQRQYGHHAGALQLAQDRPSLEQLVSHFAVRLDAADEASALRTTTENQASGRNGRRMDSRKTLRWIRVVQINIIICDHLLCCRASPSVVSVDSAIQKKCGFVECVCLEKQPLLLSLPRIARKGTTNIAIGQLERGKVQHILLLVNWSETRYNTYCYWSIGVRQGRTYVVNGQTGYFSEIRQIFPLTNGSDIKQVFLLTNGSDVKYVFPLTNGSDVKYIEVSWSLLLTLNLLPMLTKPSFLLPDRLTEPTNFILLGFCSLTTLGNKLWMKLSWLSRIRSSRSLCRASLFFSMNSPWNKQTKKQLTYCTNEWTNKQTNNRKEKKKQKRKKHKQTKVINITRD